MAEGNGQQEAFLEHWPAWHEKELIFKYSNIAMFEKVEHLGKMKDVGRSCMHVFIISSSSTLFYFM